MVCIGIRFSRRRWHVLAAAAWLCVGVCALSLIGHVAMAQSPQPPPATGSASAPTAPATPEPATQSGVITEIGRWLNRSANPFSEQRRQAARGAANATIDAATSIIRLPGTRMIAGRQRCERAENGAPDCQAAATVLCRGRGFQTGRSLDFQSEEKCPASAWLSGRTAAANECTTEHYVTRAVCQ